MRTHRRWVVVACLVTGLAVLAAPAARASTIAIGIGAFDPGSTLTTFTGLSNGKEVNNLVVDGLLFQYSLGNGDVVIDGGPGVTNNIAPPNVVSVGNDSGVLAITFPSLISQFGYGFAIESFGVNPASTTISLFDGAVPVGSLSYGGAPDPMFTGGFAGIQSTLAFNRAELTFNSAVAPAFAVDNIRTSSNTVPEPGTLLLVGAGIGAIVRRGGHTRGEGRDSRSVSENDTTGLVVVTLHHWR